MPAILLVLGAASSQAALALDADPGTPEPMLNRWPEAVEIVGDQMYLGGGFTDAAGIKAADYIARWGASGWSPVGPSGADKSALNGQVNAIAVLGSDVYVGGQFTDAAGISEADYIARWDGRHWSAVGSDGLGGGALNGEVFALTVADGKVYAGGRFNRAGELNATTRIAMWDGHAWTTVGPDPTGNVSLRDAGHVAAIAVSGSDVYIGGLFLDLGGDPAADMVARWDGTRWSSLGARPTGDGPLGCDVYAITRVPDGLLVGGCFSNAVGLADTRGLAHWDGNRWSALGVPPPTLGGGVTTIVASGDDVYAGGSVHLARWHDGGWDVVAPTSAIGQVTAVAVAGGDVFVAGNYGREGGIGVVRGGIWQPLSGGIAGQAVARPLRDTLPLPKDLITDPVIVIQSLLVTTGVLVFIPFPSALFNSTLEANYAEVQGWARSIRGYPRRLMRRLLGRGGRAAVPSNAPVASADALPGAEPTQGREELASSTTGNRSLWVTPIGVVAFVLLTALLACFLDPTLGPDMQSLATFAGITAGLAVVLAISQIPAVLAYRQRGIAFHFEALPGTAVIGVGCVLVSRLTEFQPGYLYGLIVGLVAGQELSTDRAGRSAALASVAVLVTALIAWVGLAALASPSSGADPGFGQAVVKTALTTIVVGGLEGVAFGLLPLRFLAGDKVRRWNTGRWAVLIGFALFAFWHVLVNPTSGYLAGTGRSSLVVIVGLLVVFGLGSVAFWGYFRFRRRPSLLGSTP